MQTVKTSCKGTEIYLLQRLSKEFVQHKCFRHGGRSVPSGRLQFFGRNFTRLPWNFSPKTRKFQKAENSKPCKFVLFSIFLKSRADEETVKERLKKNKIGGWPQIFEI